MEKTGSENLWKPMWYSRRCAAFGFWGAGFKSYFWDSIKETREDPDNKLILYSWAALYTWWRMQRHQRPTCMEVNSGFNSASQTLHHFQSSPFSFSSLHIKKHILSRPPNPTSFKKPWGQHAAMKEKELETKKSTMGSGLRRPALDSGQFSFPAGCLWASGHLASWLSFICKMRLD